MQYHHERSFSCEFCKSTNVNRKEVSEYHTKCVEQFKSKIDTLKAELRNASQNAAKAMLEKEKLISDLEAENRALWRNFDDARNSSKILTKISESAKTDKKDQKECVSLDSQIEKAASLFRPGCSRKHRDIIWRCHWSPKEDVLCTVSNDKTARIWTKEVVEMAPHSLIVNLRATTSISLH